jgi:dihydroxyacetone kinase-like protein
VNFDPNFVYRTDAPLKGKVAIVSGRGSGHKLIHAGFVGMEMLDAACLGDVFTSPTPDQILEAAKKVGGGAGVLYIIKNYSGDIMNFEMATELAHAEGIRVFDIVIDDDAAVKGSLYTQGRWGLATMLAEKTYGVAAAQGCDLKQVADLCRRRVQS